MSELGNGEFAEELEFVPVPEVTEKKQEIEEKKAKPKSSPVVNAIRISGVRSGHVMFKGMIREELFFRLIPVKEWSGKDEQEFEEKYFLGAERPSFANR